MGPAYLNHNVPTLYGDNEGSVSLVKNPVISLNIIASIQAGILTTIFTSGSQIPSADEKPVIRNVTCGLDYPRLG